ncbi:MAG: hypothetical protein LBI03_00195, partial [Clostridiales bacterium]|nr:hypothetical protein [Clostridiales bacterium]
MKKVHRFGKKSKLPIIFFIIVIAVIFIYFSKPWMLFVESISIETSTSGGIPWTGEVQADNDIYMIIRFTNGSIWKI